MNRLVLVIDDEQAIRSSLQGALSDEGYQVLTASSGQQALDLMSKKLPDLVLLDIWMPEMDGIETLKKIRQSWANQPVIMMSGHGTIETAVKSTKLGAFDFVEKPLSLERVLVLMKNALNASDLAMENKALRKKAEKDDVLLGCSRAMQQIQQVIAQVGPTTGSVLITGENGTGKELVARALHAASPRFSRPFVDVNCAAIPEELIESELFGHEKGAFTGALSMRREKFDLANEGTLFLDEIGDMSLKTQAKILRILQEQKFERVGGTETIKVDVRILAATNKDLKREIKEGNFREDLYYRLNVIPFQVPPLRERREDIPLLTQHFLAHYAQAYGKKPRAMPEDALRVLAEYAWPGNVRELKNLIERLMILTTAAEDGHPISVAEVLKHLRDEFSGSFSETTDRILRSATVNLKDARHEFEKEFILKTLKENDWNVSRTAAALGVERSHLHRKIKSMGIENV